MPEEKIKEIIDRNKSRDQKIIGTAITIAIAVCGWYLSSINSQMSTFNEKIVESNLKTNELMIRMIKTEENIESNKIDIKELSKRTGTLERVVEGHERQLRAK